MQEKNESEHNDPGDDHLTEIRITNVSPPVKHTLKIIAKNHGVELGSFLKMKLRELMDSYPEHMKKEKPDD